MNALNNLKTSVKLIGSFILIAILLVALAVLSFFQMKSINDGMTTMYFDRLVPVKQLGNIKADLYTIRGDVYKALLIPDEKAASEASIPVLIKNVDDNFTAYTSTLLLDSEKAELAVFEPAWVEYKAAIAEILALENAGKRDAAIASLIAGGRASNARKAVSASSDKLLAINVNTAEETNTQGDVTFVNATWLLVILSVIAVLMALGLGIVISNSIANPLAFLTRLARAISVGDLVRDVSEAEKDKVRLRKDEIGAISQAFDALINYMQGMGAAATTIAKKDLTVSVVPNSAKDELGNAFAGMLTGLREVIGQVTESANAVTAASAQLATASEQSGEATSQIATTIQQVALGTAQQTAGVTKTSGAVE
ncbi:MAG: MCP four helix bundle domain-containing protein, partial [Chloroflexota bacterium]